MIKTDVSCFKCGKELENLIPGGNQPLEGVEFTSPGGYGSTVFDPMADTSVLVINICDGCLVKHKDAIIRRYHEIKRVDYRYIPWEPNR